MTFTNLQPYGDGLVVTTDPAINGQGPVGGDPYRTWQYWGDSGNEHYVGTSYETVEWDWDNGLVAWKVDDVVQTPANNLQYSWEIKNTQTRPTALWFGNAGVVSGGYNWTSFSVDYIEVDAVPEPSCLLALVFGLGGVIGLRRK
jgi:hypothetical protein